MFFFYFNGVKGEIQEKKWLVYDFLMSTVSTAPSEIKPVSHLNISLNVFSDVNGVNGEIQEKKMGVV